MVLASSVPTRSPRIAQLTDWQRVGWQGQKCRIGLQSFALKCHTKFIVAKLEGKHCRKKKPVARCSGML